jgi:hypothetical protein
MGLLAAALDAFEDKNAKPDELIKSGSLRTTRGAALVAFSVVAIMVLLNQFAPEVAGLDQLTAAQKFFGAIAIGFAWVVTVAADSIARGLASARSSTAAASYASALGELATQSDKMQAFRVFQPPLPVELSDKHADDEKGWLVVGSALRNSALQLCIVKGDKVEWRQAGDGHVHWKSM